MSAPPLLAGIVVHWRNERELAALLDAWPVDDRFELVVVDNGSSGNVAEGRARWIQPGRNLGFSGGVNAGVAATTAPWVLILNPDARPEPGALDAVLAGATAHPEAAGVVPRLLGDDGAPQFTWQLRPLPRPGQLLLQAFFLPGVRGARQEPEPGAAIEQPAAAALALRREALARVGGFDESFYPAWFEDVDLAARFRDAGLAMLYWPAAVFRHGLGSSVASLGYGRFLLAYSRNLERYLRKHHGALWAGAARLALAAGALVRLVALPLRRPRRASSRTEAARALLAVAWGALAGWPAPAAPGNGAD